MDSLIHHFLIVAEGFNVPPGEVYMPIEASKGELGVYMKSNGGPKPERVHFRGPSFVNLSALPVMSEGEMVADVVAIIGSLDIVLGEIDKEKEGFLKVLVKKKLPEGSYANSADSRDL